MSNNWIPNSIFEYFASIPIHPMFEVSRIANDKDHKIHGPLYELSKQVPLDLINKMKMSTKFNSLYGNSDNKEWYARETVIIEELLKKISIQRIKIISNQLAIERPKPIPVALVVKSGSKTLCRFSGGMPGPVSEKLTSTS